MKVTLIVVGKTDKSYFREAIQEYEKRLKHYINFKIQVVPDIKNYKRLNTDTQKLLEGEKILSGDLKGKEIILMDEKGEMFTSKEFAEFFERKIISGLKEIVFIIGGPYGFSQKVYERADLNISLSKMTFSHQMARLLFIEQLYRAFTIIKGESYHHE